MRKLEGCLVAATAARGSTSASRKSPRITVTFGSASASSAAARSRSISYATMAPAAAASRRVSAPGPGPISTNTWSGFGSIARKTLSAHAGSRKCCPNCFLARGFTITVVVVLVVVRLLAAPVLLLDLLDFFFAQAEVVADLVNQGLADADDEVVFVLGLAFVRALKDQHAVGKHVAVARRALGQRRPLIEPEERVGRLDLHVLEEIRGRLVLDDDRDVLHRIAEPSRNGGERLGDVALEDGAFHRRVLFF